MAVHLAKADLLEPAQLRTEAGESIGGIVLRPTDRAPKALVLLCGCRADQIEVDEYSVRSEQIANLSEQGALALVLQVVNHQPRHNRVKRSIERKWGIEIMLVQLYRWVGREALCGPGDHRRGEVHSNRLGAGMGLADERDQATVSTTEVREALNVLR
jgi:hypothetical protein